MNKDNRKHERHNVIAKLCTGLLAAVLFVMLIAGSAMALEEPDLTQKGSISLSLIDKTTNKAIPGGELEFILVASLQDVDGLKYVPTGAFDDAEFTYSLETDEELADAQLAKDIDAFANTHSGAIAGDQLWTVKIGDDGVAELTDLTLGLYLIRQTVPAEGYTKINPFLVTVPMAEKDEAGYVTEYIYDVDATPKPEKVSQEETTTPKETETTTTPSRVPQTGQLWWPVFVLCGLGVLCVIAGVILFRFRQKVNR